MGAPRPASARCGPAPTGDVKTRTPRSVGTCDRLQRPRAASPARPRCCAGRGEARAEAWEHRREHRGAREQNHSRTAGAGSPRGPQLRAETKPKEGTEGGGAAPAPPSPVGPGPGRGQVCSGHHGSGRRGGRTAAPPAAGRAGRAPGTPRPPGPPPSSIPSTAGLQGQRSEGKGVTWPASRRTPDSHPGVWDALQSPPSPSPQCLENFGFFQEMD